MFIYGIIWLLFLPLEPTALSFSLSHLTVLLLISLEHLCILCHKEYLTMAPMASLFRSLCGMPGIAPRMDVLSWGRRDFQISFSNRDTSRNAWNRHWGSFMVDLIKQYEVSLSQMLNDILWPDHNIRWQPPTDQTLYRTRPFIEFRVVSIEHLPRVWHADRGRLLLRTPGPVPFGICICSSCWDQLPKSIRHCTSLWHFYRTCNYRVWQYAK